MSKYYFIQEENNHIKEHFLDKLTSAIKSDDYIFDFIRNCKCLYMVNLINKDNYDKLLEILQTSVSKSTDEIKTKYEESIKKDSTCNTFNPVDIISYIDQKKYGIMHSFISFSDLSIIENIFKTVKFN